MKISKSHIFIFISISQKNLNYREPKTGDGSFNIKRFLFKILNYWVHRSLPYESDKKDAVIKYQESTKQKALFIFFFFK